MDFFAGKKTHFVGIIMILTGLVQLVMGPVTQLGDMDSGEATRLVMEGLGLMGIRLGVQKAITK